MDVSSRGGLHARLARTQAAEGPRPLTSELAVLLVQEALWGHISPPLLQKICAAASSDVKCAVLARNPAFHFDELDRLGGLGSEGEHVNNIWKEFKTILEPSQFHANETFSCPMKKIAARNGYVTSSQPINDPHAMLADIWKYYPEAIRMMSRSSV